MAKLPITPPTYAVNNVQQLPDIVIGDASAVKTTHDKTGSDGKNYIVNTLIAELNGSTGANMIGHSNPNIASNNVADAVEEVRQIAVQAQAGSIVDNSIGNIKLEADIKVGSLATLTTTDKDSVTDAINEVDANADTAQATATSANNLASSVSTILNIARTAKTSTGSAVAYAVDTDGTFDLTKDGNRIMFVPNVANSGSCTVAVDSQTAKNTRKANDAGTYVVLEAGDVKQGVPTEFVWSVANDFFILRPSGGGSNIKSIQRGSTVLSGTTVSQSITSVDTTKSVMMFYFTSPNNLDAIASNSVRGVLDSATSMTFSRNQTGSVSITVYWIVIEYNNVKSLQRGVTTANAGTTNVTITSVNMSKSIVFSSLSSSETGSPPYAMSYSSELTSATNLQLLNTASTAKSISWQVIEFK